MQGDIGGTEERAASASVLDLTGLITSEDEDDTCPPAAGGATDASPLTTTPASGSQGCK